MEHITPFIIVSYLGAIAIVVYLMILYYRWILQKPEEPLLPPDDEVDHIKQFEDSPEFSGYHREGYGGEKKCQNFGVGC